VTTNPQRIERARALIESHHPIENLDYVADLIFQNKLQRFVLIEYRYDSGYWFTPHATPAEAAAYHLNQECPEDWEIVELVDLDLDVHYSAEVEITWTEKERHEV
jgi:hypothetical protein